MDASVCPHCYKVFSFTQRQMPPWILGVVAALAMTLLV